MAQAAARSRSNTVDTTILAGTALAHLRAGRRAEAAEIYAKILETQPLHEQALLLLAALQIDGKDYASAEELLRRYLTITPNSALALHNLGKLRHLRGDDESAVDLFERAILQNANFAPTFNDLGVSLHQLGRLAAALAAFDRAIAIDADFIMARCNRGRVLLAMDRAQEAADVFCAVLALAPDSPEVWCSLGIAALHIGELDRAEDAFQHVIAADPTSLIAVLKLAETLERAHRPQEAARQFREWSRRQGITVMPCIGNPEARILLIGGAEPCNTSTEFLLDRRRFERIATYLLPPGDPDADLDALVARLPPHDIVFNTIGDPDRGAPYLTQAEALLSRLDRPVLNPARRVAATRRDTVVSRLAGIEGLVIPKTQHRSRQELLELAAAPSGLGWPALVRPFGSHGGIDLKRIEGPSDLRGYLGEMPFADYYLSPYCDYRSDDGLFRKYRLIFVEGEIYPYHLAIGEHWLVHYWRTNMRRFDWMKREEAAFLADYRSVFSGARGDAVREVARRLDLDYGGMDCGITRDGQVLLFEANASMLVQLNDSRDDFAYKHEYVPRIFDAVSRMITRRVGLG